MSDLGTFFTAFKEKFLDELKVGDIGQEINLAIQPHKLFDIRIGGLTLGISDAVVATWIAMVVIAILAWALGRKPKVVPTGRMQLIAETLINLLLNLCRSSGMTYEQSEKVVPYIGTIALFISVSNLLSMFKISPPAKNPAFPIALAIITITYVIATSIRLVGVKGFLRSLVYPKALLLPFRLLDYLIKPLSLSLRLFGNIFGAYILMEFIYLIVPAILPGIVGLWFDLADGLLQAVIFTYLTATYIGEVVESAHASAHAGDHAEPAAPQDASILP
jgi:F-type H+-transporting ATPase subunit a